MCVKRRNTTQFVEFPSTSCSANPHWFAPLVELELSVLLKLQLSPKIWSGSAVYSSHVEL